LIQLRAPRTSSSGGDGAFGGVPGFAGGDGGVGGGSGFAGGSEAPVEGVPGFAGGNETSVGEVTGFEGDTEVFESFFGFLVSVAGGVVTVAGPGEPAGDGNDAARVVAGASGCVVAGTGADGVVTTGLGAGLVAEGGVGGGAAAAGNGGEVCVVAMGGREIGWVEPGLGADAVFGVPSGRAVGN